MCFPCRCGRKFVLLLRKIILFGDFIVLFVYEIEVQKRYRTQKGQSKMDNPEKLTTYGIQDEDWLT